MQGTFDFIPAVGEKRKQKKAVLSKEENNKLQALKRQRAELNQKIQQIDPNNAQRKRTVKRNEAMSHLLKLSEMNKELKRVGWANSGKSSRKQFELDAQKPEELQMHKGWQVHDTRDISGDGIADVVIYDETGAIRAVNGNTITKSKYPERQQYYNDYDEPIKRRAIRNKETGEPINYKVDQNGDKYDPQYTSYGDFKKNTYNKVEVNAEGNVQYTNAQTARLKKLTPYKVFINIIMNKYWNAIKNREDLIENIPKHLRMRFYGLLKKYTWNLIKDHAISERLQLEIPNNKEEREFIEKSNNFKQAITDDIKQILQIVPEEMFNYFDVAFGKAKEFLYGVAQQEAKIANGSVKESTSKKMWKRIINAYGISEEDAPFNEIFNNWKQNGKGMNFSEWLNNYIENNIGGNEEEDDVLFPDEDKLFLD